MNTASSNIVSGDRVSDDISIDSPQWFDWLGQQSSFRYEGDKTNFTCTRRPNGKWYGVKKIYSSDKGSVPIALYIGSDKDCTLAKLHEIHQRFSMDNWDFWRWYHSPERKDRKGKKKQIPGGYTTDSDCITEIDSKETTNAVRQWCVFARHNDGKLQFMGGYWSKGDATARMHKSQRDHHLSESIGDKAYIGPPPTYEVREMLVAPVGLYNQSADCITETQKAGADDLKEEIRRLQAVVRLEKQQKEMCQHKLDKAQQSNKELGNLVREARAELERLQSSTNSADPGAILNRLRKEHKNSKASLKDVEVIIELLQAIVL